MIDERQENSPVENRELTVCTEALAKSQEQLRYLQADFENFRRRTEKDRSQWMQIAQTDVLKNILTIVDDFDRALQSQHDAGFELIHKALVKLLGNYGVEVMRDVTVFDPEKHEAIMHVATADKEPGSIVEVLQKGYIHKGSVLRPAQVSVAQ